MPRLDTAGHHEAGSWAELVDSYIAASAPTYSVESLLRQFRETDPLRLTTAIDPAVAESHKESLAEFLLHAIRAALSDHALSDSEVHVIRHVCRILRIQEGDLLASHRSAVVGVLANEMQRLLEDDLVDPNEAIHKAKLQEILGLSYDEFVALTAPQIEGVLVRLLRRVDPSLGPADLAERIHWFRDRVSALDTVYNFNPAGSRTDRTGFIYLLVNPAMPGILKIGKTARPPATRVVELSGATGVPVPFELLFDVRVLDARKAESYVHDKLEQLGTRVAGNREFFSAPPNVAVEMMLEARDVVGGFDLVDETPHPADWTEV